MNFALKLLIAILVLKCGGALEAQELSPSELAIKLTSIAYKAAATIEYNSVITAVDIASKPTVQKKFVAHVVLKKPNLMFVSLKEAGKKAPRWIMVSNGKDFCECDLEARIARNIPCEGVLPAYPDIGALRLVFYQSFYYEEPFEAMMKGVKSSEVVSPEVVDDEPCTVIKRVLDANKYSMIWIANSDNLPRRSASYRIDGSTLQELYREERTDIIIDGKLPSALFEWKPPPGTRILR